MNIAVSGATSLICRAASNPLMTGICMSNITTSGLSILTFFDGYLAVLGFTTYLPICVLLDEGSERMANVGVVIDDQNSATQITATRQLGRSHSDKVRLIQRKNCSIQDTCAGFQQEDNAGDCAVRDEDSPKIQHAALSRRGRLSKAFPKREGTQRKAG